MSKSRNHVPQKKHADYLVDQTFSRTKQYRYKVSEMTEAEAKDLVCDMMDCVAKLQVKVLDMKLIFEENHFAIKNL